MFDNGDNLNCATGVVGSVITLDCHGFRSSADWTVNPDGSVDTNVIGVVYGEFEAASAHFAYTP